MGSATLILGLAGTQGVPRWLSMFDRLRNDAYRERRELLNATALLSAERTINDTLVRRWHRWEAERHAVIDDWVPAAAAARLRSHVSVAASAAGLVLQSIDLRPDSSATHALRRPAVRGEARGDISGLAQFLLLIEMGPPLMRVSDLTIIQPDPVGGRDRSEELRISFLIEGTSLAAASLERP